MSGPKCYRYSVDRARLQQQLEAERQQRELRQHQQAIEQCRAEQHTLSGALAELQTRYPGETLQLDLTPPAPPDENTVDAYAQQVIGETLTELGYEVELGFSTLFVEGGVAQIQKPEWGDYYVQLRVKPDVSDLNLNVVRVGGDDHAAVSNEQARRDREMEEQWCAAHRTLLERLEVRGIASRQTRALAPGALPVQTLQPDAIQQPGRMRRRQMGLHRRQL